VPTLDELEARLKGRAADFAGLGALVRFDYGAAGELFVDARQAPPAVSRSGGDPRTTIRMAPDDFVRMLDGALSPMWAFTTGKLKVQGDTGLAMKLASLLDG
jgi:putative sterol carrier protein